LKPENILIFSNNGIYSFIRILVFKICDLGISKRINNIAQQLMTKNIGTPYYMAPEMLEA
jgi:serine/threonine protein kinase